MVKCSKADVRRLKTALRLRNACRFDNVKFSLSDLSDRCLPALRASDLVDFPRGAKRGLSEFEGDCNEGNGRDGSGRLHREA
jgi:hypothetical protein